MAAPNQTVHFQILLALANDIIIAIIIQVADPGVEARLVAFKVSPSG
jgi:hypothetical protein